MMRLMQSVCLAALAVAITAAGANAQVAINEVDYDNPGQDPSEFVELVGRAGTVLDGWTLRGINANDGSVYADYVLQGSIAHDFDSAWGGKGGFFVIGRFDAETTARAQAINTGSAPANSNQGYGSDGLPNTADDGVWANTSPDFTPANWTAAHNIQNGSFGDGPGDVLQLWSGTPGSSTLIDEWYYDYDPGYFETGLSEGIESYDSAGTNNGHGGDIKSIGRLGYSYSEPILVFDGEAMAGLDLFDRMGETSYPPKSWTFEGTEAFTADVNGVTFSVNPDAGFTEAHSDEIDWCGTSDYGPVRGPTPGTFNNASYGAGSQDAFTINLLPPQEEPAPGDADNDGDVDAADAEIVADHWGKATGNGSWDGDFNGDGFVNVMDAAILAANWNPPSSESTAIPEPSAFVLFALAAFCGVLSRRRAVR